MSLKRKVGDYGSRSGEKRQRLSATSKEDRQGETYRATLKRLMLQSRPFRVIVVGDEYILRVRLSPCSRLFSTGATHDDAKTVSMPSSWHVTTFVLEGLQIADHMGSVDKLGSRYMPKARSLWDVLRRELMSTGESPASPDLIIVLGGLNDIRNDHQPQNGPQHQFVTAAQKRAFYQGAMSGLQRLRDDLDKDGRSCVFWAGFGRTSNALKQLKAYHEFIKDKVGAEDWHPWLRYKCFVGDWMSGNEDFDQGQVKGVTQVGRQWHCGLAEACCTELIEQIKNVRI